MKKLLICVLVAFMLLAGCSSNKGSDDSKEETLATVVETVLADCVDLPDYEVVELDADSFASFAFVDYKEGYQAVEADALINATPHSVVVIKVEDTSEVKDLANSIFDNADSRKWVCQEAEKVAVSYNTEAGLIVLVMSTIDICDQAVANFEAKYSGSESLTREIEWDF